MTELAVSVSGLSKVYQVYDRPFDRLRQALSPTRQTYAKQVHALEDVSFDVPQGATVGIVGANGAGKSTLLKILANRLRPTSGKVEVRGRVNGILELGTGLQPALTGRQNAHVNGLFMGLDPWKIDQQIERIIAFSELGDKIDQPLETYSSGMKARLAFSVLVAIEPEILVLDEALATGDSGFAEKCTRYIRGLCRSGCTTLMVSHDIHFLAKACQHLVWIDKGRLREQGPPDRVAQAYLESFGETGILGDQRPRYLTFRIDPVVSGEDVEYSAHCVSWLCSAGDADQAPEAYREEGSDHALLQSHFVGFDNVLREVTQDALLGGFSTTVSGAPWGESKLLEGIPGPFRKLRPAAGPGGSAYLVLPVPQHPLPRPSAIQVFGENTLSNPLQLSVSINGEFVKLGEFGTAELARTLGGQTFASPPMDLSSVLAAFEAPSE